MQHDTPTADHSAAPVRSSRHGLASVVLPLPSTSCRECLGSIERQLLAHPHVAAVHLDAAHQVAHLQVHEGTVSADELAELLASACGDRNEVPLPRAEVSSHAHAHALPGAPVPAVDHAAMGHGAHDMSNPNLAAAMEADMRRRFWVSLILSIPVVLYSSLATSIFGLVLPVPLGLTRDWIMLLFSTPVALWASSVFHLGAYLSLRSGVLNMSVLVSLGILTSYLFSLGLTLLAPGQETFYEAAVMLAVFLLFGHWMEMKARRGSSDSVRKLLDLTPQRATVERNGQVLELPLAEVVVDDLVILKPGDRVPVDGIVVDGTSSLDESMVTGESIPVEKEASDQVIAGTINQSGSLRFRTTRVGADTALAQIVRMVETAQNSKAPAQRIADRAAHYLVLVAVSSGLLTFLIWLLIAREPLLLSLTFAVTAVVIACPDALGLATPTAVMVATDLAARRGILFKQAVSLEQASKIQTVIFDKTGTLTEGRPRVTEVVAIAAQSEAELLELAGAAEARSGHPLAQAVLDELDRRGLATSSQVEQFESLAGRGVAATIAGRSVLVGTRRLLQERNIPLGALDDVVERLLVQGRTLMLIAVDGQARGLVAAADTVRPGAARAISELKRLGIEPVMMTGDNRRTAEAVANQVGIARVFAEVLPQDKAAGVKQLQAEGSFVAMVGDGINDAPALAQADLGIAIGAGTDVAVETGDIVLMRSDPLDVLGAIHLSRATVRKMKQNLFWAAIYNLIAIPIAAGALHPAFGLMLRPEFGALAMSASSITVVANALLLRREVKPFD